MTKKLFSFFLLAALVAGFAGLGVHSASAADQVFPVGCASAIGSSVTTGSPCNGTSVATQLSAGCTSPIGYSTVNGVPCSGTGIAMTYLGGCTSVYGYSVATGSPCNGTSIAVTDPGTVIPPVTTPGLPTTAGSDNMSLNLALLGASALVAVSGFTYLARRSALAR